MIKALTILILFIPFILTAQSGLSVTGRASLRVHQLEYDDKSEIKPDSIASDQYAKSGSIPGLQQTLNLSLFARTQSVDITVLADVRNNDWNSLDYHNLNSIDRMTLNIRTGKSEFVIGDFFESGDEVFIQSREVRGARFRTRIENKFGTDTYLNINALGGQIEKSQPVNSRLVGLYRQFETTGQFRRYAGAGWVEAGKTGVYNFTIKTLWGQDEKSSIDSSFNDPVENLLYGANANWFLWDQRMRLFGDVYFSDSNNTTTQKDRDNSFHAGFDFQNNQLKMILLFQRIGYNYFTAGYPFLEIDKQGLKGQVNYRFNKTWGLTSDFEVYKNNLDDIASQPTKTTQIANLGLLWQKQNWPEMNFKFGLRSDQSNTITNADGDDLNTDRLTTRAETGISYNFNSSRLSLSGIGLKLDDKSLIPGGTPLGTDQWIVSLNFYTRPSNYLFISGGAVYSDLKMTSDQTITNAYAYETIRWDIVPQRLKFENTLTLINNDAGNGGIQDLLSDYLQLTGEVSLEYFFNYNISFKLLAGIDSRDFRYSIDQALEVISNPDYGPLYFNGNETYRGVIIGGELNWNF